MGRRKLPNLVEIAEKIPLLKWVEESGNFSELKKKVVLELVNTIKQFEMLIASHWLKKKGFKLHEGWEIFDFHKEKICPIIEFADFLRNIEWDVYHKRINYKDFVKTIYDYQKIINKEKEK